MPITIKLFASLRERAGWSERQLAATDCQTVAQARAWLTQQVALPASVLVAVDQTYADDTTPVQDGSEVAFFPPVTGG